jgi:DNA-binding MarR family transcriptional regulator
MARFGEARPPKGRRSPWPQSRICNAAAPLSARLTGGFAEEIGIFKGTALQQFALWPVYFPKLRDTDWSLAAMSEVSLTGWMKALIAYVRSGEPDLTNRQMALLMLVYLTPGPHTVRGLARVLGVSKPVVTRALNTLGALGYLRRERDQDDRRNVFVVRTSSGAEFLEGFKRNIREGDTSSAAHRPVIGQAAAYAHQR